MSREILLGAAAEIKQNMKSIEILGLKTS